MVEGLYTMTQRKPARGFRGENRVGKKIGIVFDDDTFDQIQALATERKWSFSRVARELIEFGLLDVEEGRRHG